MCWPRAHTIFVVSLRAVAGVVIGTEEAMGTSRRSIPVSWLYLWSLAGRAVPLFSRSALHAAVGCLGGVHLDFHCAYQAKWKREEKTCVKP